MVLATDWALLAGRNRQGVLRVCILPTNQRTLFPILAPGPSHAWLGVPSRCAQARLPQMLRAEAGPGMARPAVAHQERDAHLSRSPCALRTEVASKAGFGLP